VGGKIDRNIVSPAVEAVEAVEGKIEADTEQFIANEVHHHHSPARMWMDAELKAITFSGVDLSNLW
jgi:hypothetical protein